MAFKTFTRTTKVMADFLQITGTVGSVYSVTLPNVLLEFLASLDFISFDWVTIFGVPVSICVFAKLYRNLLSNNINFTHVLLFVYIYYINSAWEK